MTRVELETLGVPSEACGHLALRTYREMAKEILNWGVHEDCRFIVRGDDGYPALLAEIHDAPLVLYARGNLDLLGQPCIAVVGTRKPTFYGLQMAEGLASDITCRGVAVVSGLARGIDAAAHRGCLAAQGRTIAVLGCGIDVVYPREHRQLTRQIAEGGLLLSEFPPGTSPSPQNFPVRNRIISGLCLGTVIVEASEYSGSLITARLALEQNREVFAIPGNLTSPQSFGPNFLIKQGAKLVQSWRDIVEEFPPELRIKILAEEDAQPVSRPELELLSADEIRIMELLETDHATQFDKIYQTSGLAIPILSDLLLKLEMRGRIRQVPGNLYVKVARPER
ncbi:MAG TPA: DNA-processing protein DprA [Acidobacteriota bacterium]|nr:DNA-processing protein DprA [Acidobacteriota bacterium]